MRLPFLCPDWKVPFQFSMIRIYKRWTATVTTNDKQALLGLLFHVPIRNWSTNLEGWQMSRKNFKDPENSINDQEQQTLYLSRMSWDSRSRRFLGSHSSSKPIPDCEHLVRFPNYLTSLDSSHRLRVLGSHSGSIKWLSPFLSPIITTKPSDSRYCSLCGLNCYQHP